MRVHDQAGESASGTSLSELMSIILRRTPSIVLFTAAALGLALAYIATATPLYTASTSVFIDPRSRNVVPEEVLQTNIGSDTALVESQVSIIGSDSVLRRVVVSMQLADDPEFTPQRGTGLLSQLKALIRPPTADPDKVQRAVTALSEQLKVKRAQKTYVVDVEVTSASPVKAARLSSAIVEAYLQDQSANKSDEARRISSLIDARLDELRNQLRQAEVRVDEFKKANGILASEGGLVNERRLTRLNGELITARAVAAESKARLDLVTSAIASGGSPDYLPDAIRSGLVQRLREQYAQVARREAALSTQLQARHPVLIEARSQLAEIKGQIAAELKRISTGAHAEHQLAENRLAEITRSLEQAQQEVGRTNTAQIRLRELEQDVSTSRDLLNTFLARAKQTQEQQNLSISEARVISPASVPTRPSRPIGWLVVSLALLGGLGLGISRALIADHMHRAVTSRREVVNRTGRETIGAIPTIKPRGLGRFLRAPGSAEPIGFSDIMSAIANPRSMRNGEAFRQAVLRTLGRIHAMAADDQPILTMLLAPHTGAGASATALAFAYAAAETGERVLLIDASSQNTDLSNTLARDFEHKGLIELDNIRHLQAIVRRDGRTGLSFLPIALADLRTLRFDQRKRLRAGIAALASDYDLVFIDGGAVLEDESAEALLPIADQIVLVARVGATSPASIDETLRVLQPVSGRIVGTVLNRSKSAKTS